MADYLIACGVLILVILFWTGVQFLGRWFAKRHPEFGPYVEKRGCGGTCDSCGEGDSCNSNS